MTPEVRLDLVPAAGVRVLWPAIAPLIEKGCNRSPELDPNRIGYLAARGDIWIWLFTETATRKPLAAAAVRMETWRDGVTARVVVVGGGGLPRWKHLIPEFMAELKRRGAKRMIGDPRSGWLRVVPGFKQISITAEVEL